MSERKAGWYWVKTDFNKEWEAAQFDGNDWHVTRADHEWDESMLDEIGHRIPTPEETGQPPWMQAVDDMLVVSGMGTAEPSDDIAAAKRKLGELIDWHVAVALNERVNGGWRLVPVEPTSEMMQAGRWSGAGDVSVNEEWARRELWRRMLAAAPKP